MNAIDHGAEQDETPDIRVVGAVVAALIALGVAVAGWWLLPDNGWLFGLVGLPGTTVLAWRLAPRAVSGRGRAPLRVAVQLAFRSIVIADILVVGAFVGWAAITAFATAEGGIEFGAVIVTIAQTAVWSVATVAIGAVFVGIPAAIVVAPAAVVWVMIVRRIARGSTG